MNNELEDKWYRDDYLPLIDSIDGISDIKSWNIFLAARRLAHSENEDAFKAFTLNLVDDYEKEIQKLKEEIKSLKLSSNNLSAYIDTLKIHYVEFQEGIKGRDKLLEQVYEYENPASESDEFWNKWLKDFEELKK